MTGGGRDLAARLAIAGGVVIGAWTVFVGPKVERLREARGRIEAMRSTGGVLDPTVTDALVTRFAALEAATREVRARAEAGRDGTTLYRLIKAAAREHDVRLESLRPGETREERREHASFHVTPATMTAEGRFADVANFVDEVLRAGACTRLRSLHLTPAGDRSNPRVVARVSLETLAFDTPEAAASPAGEMNERARRTMLSLLTLAAPVVAVRVIGGALGGGPVAAEAGAVPPTLPEELLAALSTERAAPADQGEDADASRAAAEHARRLREAPIEASPFYHAPPPIVSEVASEPAPVVVPPILDLRGVMMFGEEAVALIDRRQTRVGDEIAGGEWYVSEIDAAARTVTLVHRISGAEHVLDAN